MEEKGLRKPGVCFPWEEKRKELPLLSGNQELVKQVWEEVDLLGYIFIWHCLVSF
ncbi:MAG: hypothetical protein ACUVQZ_03920 [Candidatus Caldatribacteriaceae bacterium]